MSLLVDLAQSLTIISPEIATFVMAMFPVIELRGALPMALIVYDMPVMKAMFWSLLGNMLPISILFISLDHLLQWAKKHSPFINRILQKRLRRARARLKLKVSKYDVLALTFFISIPLPFTGAWTGTIAAFAFGLPKKQAFLAIFAGVLIAATLVATIVTSTTFVAQFFFLPQ